MANPSPFSLASLIAASRLGKLGLIERQPCDNMGVEQIQLSSPQSLFGHCGGNDIGYNTALASKNVDSVCVFVGRDEFSPWLASVSCHYGSRLAWTSSITQGNVL